MLYLPGVKEKLLSYLVCPTCEGPLDLSVSSVEDREIMEGELRCAACPASFPITSGVPRFANLEQVESDKRATAAGFGWQWQHFTQEDHRYAEQFLGWIAPVTPEFFRDKVVLEGGCGKGRVGGGKGRSGRGKGGTGGGQGRSHGGRNGAAP